MYDVEIDRLNSPLEAVIPPITGYPVVIQILPISDNIVAVSLTVRRGENDIQMKKQWNIRKATHEDSGGLQECMETAYASYQNRMSGERLPPMDIDYSLEIKDFPSWVAEFSGKIVGGLTMMFEDDCASIANIAVHPEFQGQGLGGGLMKFAETMAKEKNYSELRLATHILLTENVTLYLHLGWKEIDRDVVRVYMKKDI